MKHKGDLHLGAILSFILFLPYQSTSTLRIFKTVNTWSIQCLFSFLMEPILIFEDGLNLGTGNHLWQFKSSIITLRLQKLVSIISHPSLFCILWESSYREYVSRKQWRHYKLLDKIPKLKFSKKVFLRLQSSTSTSLKKLWISRL